MLPLSPGLPLIPGAPGKPVAPSWPLSPTICYVKWLLISVISLLLYFSNR